MAERPIIFSASMVRALLDGRKTQTRRVLKPQPPDGARYTGVHYASDEPPSWFFNSPIGPQKIMERFAIDDRLWVREAHALVPATAYRMSDGVEQTVNPSDPDTAAVYAEGWERCKPRWRPSIHMPRWASRLTLHVSDVRVQRLQEISEEDAIAEGMLRSEPTEEDQAWNREWCEEDYPGEPVVPLTGVWLAPGTRQGWGSKEQRNQPQWGPTAAFAFRHLWESIHGPGAWSANPWVCAITFAAERTKP